VSGIGTTDVKVWKVGESGPECQDISHVEFFDINPLATSTPTDGIITRNTPTVETPFKFWTFTPSLTITYPPPTTPTPPTNTPTDTQEVTQTPTQTLTLTLPPRHGKTPTPQFVLPETGMDGRQLESSDLSWLFIIVLITILLFLFARAIIRGYKKNG
jgi:hypothetical protein